MQKIDRAALVQANIAGGTAKASSTSSSNTTVEINISAGG
ncbi:hypothetical protein AWB72_02450 [Caballeronia concitans]|uniref:Uncharacterized protein n=1 Tax=Caballeronia concitans TaxID=1777133 RepID=A0A658QWP0_9BURK|nr:hypothetical protein BurMR1_0728 [Burkholderia sp. MR1]SAL29428.1 hypothetical protein AWB72_02450 [Caballeronia concitans]